ncbi:hypothetical protein CBS101457_001441 [Exobasidium rhododendri]|nr:hypothetical protein CBS101457_001441 [Exobasidium rhododendri]
MNLTPNDLSLLKLPTAVHQLRLFCTTKSAYDAALNPSHAAALEFPISCEVKVNNKPLSINLKGNKKSVRVLAPHINKDNALYFGGQENRIEFFYHNTSQKYVLSIAVCEVRNADTLARKVRRERSRSKEEVLGAMKRAAEDDDIVMGDVSMGLKCPLSYMRLNTPIRSSSCTHMQCFDAFAFFSLNEQTPAWVCPHCSKKIKPDSLFLDGYVQDILDRVPEEEETVLVDADGRWYTPNKKYTSSGAVEPASLSKESEGNEQEGREGSAAKKDSAQSDAMLPLGFPVPDAPPQSKSAKPIIEVFEIDSDNEEGEASSVVTKSDLNGSTASSRDQTYQAHHDGADNYLLPGRSPYTSSSTLQSRASPLPITKSSSEKPQGDVIDLTLSDSEDEDAAPHRSNGASIAAAGDVHQINGKAVPFTNGQFGKHENGTSFIDDRAGSNAHLTHPSRGPRPGHAFRTGGTPTLPHRPERRSNSNAEEDNDNDLEDQDPDDTGPIVRHRKKRRNNRPGEEEEKEEEEVGEKGDSLEDPRRSNSEGLYEDERAGLTLKS